MNSEAKRESNRKGYIKRRQEAVQNGICTMCFKNPASVGTLTCAACREAAAERRKEKKRLYMQGYVSEKRHRCDFDCFNCKFDDCINGEAPTTKKEKQMLDAALGGERTYADELRPGHIIWGKSP